MASESSSAVLELTDADTDAPDTSVADDGCEGTPLIMEHGHDIAVQVDAPMKQLSTLETFVTYRVRCVCARWPTPTHVRRRYNHFKVLHKRLCGSHPLLAPPPLPPLHSARQQLDRYSPAFVAIRTLALHAFLDRIAKHPILTHSEDFRVFLTAPDDEIDKVFKSESSGLSLWGLSGLYGSNADNKQPPSAGARVRHPEFSSAADYLQSLQIKLNTLCSLTTKLYKGSTALGNELLGMKRTCSVWSPQTPGPVGLAAGALSEGAGGAGAALLRPPPPLRARATIRLLADYAGAHRDKIRQRDAIHVAHVSGNNTDEVHNRLEQASEALRSELADWTPKTQAEIKCTLLEIADKQVAALTQVQMSWERALKQSTEANVEELFKTVSKTAVQNLSPSRCRSESTPTGTDLLDSDNYSDTDLQDDKPDINITNHDIDITNHDIDIINDEFSITNREFDLNNREFDITNHEIDIANREIDLTNREIDVTNREIDITNREIDVNILGDSESDKSDVFDKKRGNGVSELSLGSSSQEVSKEVVFSDPLQNFSEVDLSS